MIVTSSEPLNGVSKIVLPFNTPWVSSAWNPAAEMEKEQTRSAGPSPSTSLGVRLYPE